VPGSQARRGDIVLVAGGVYAIKPRPAVFVQDDLFDATDSVTVRPFTTSDVSAPLLRMPVPADDAISIDSPSLAMIDKITTVRHSSAGEAIGRLDSVQMVQLERRILVFIGLAH